MYYLLKLRGFYCYALPPRWHVDQKKFLQFRMEWPSPRYVSNVTRLPTRNSCDEPVVDSTKRDERSKVEMLRWNFRCFPFPFFFWILVSSMIFCCIDRFLELNHDCIFFFAVWVPNQKQKWIMSDQQKSKKKGWTNAWERVSHDSLEHKQRNNQGSGSWELTWRYQLYYSCRVLRVVQQLLTTEMGVSKNFNSCLAQGRLPMNHMRLSLVTSCLGPLFAIFIGALWFLWPVLLRLQRIPQVIVAPEDKDKDALRLGLLGASFIARMAVVHPAQKRQDVQVMAVAARSRDKAKRYAESHGIPLFYGGATAYDDLLAREDVDAIYVGLPTKLHVHWTLKALKAGKHVLLEKPAVLSTDEAEEILRMMSKTGKVAFEGAHHRYHPIARRFRELMSDLEMWTSEFFVSFICRVDVS